MRNVVISSCDEIPVSSAAYQSIVMHIVRVQIILLYSLIKSISIISPRIDANNVMILAPADVAPIIPANYESEERIGNLCKEHAKILARYMDSGSFSLDCTKYDCNVYSEGFIFTCTLLENTNHAAFGYAVRINVCTQNSKVWIESIFDDLFKNDLNPTMK